MTDAQATEVLPAEPQAPAASPAVAPQKSLETTSTGKLSLASLDDQKAFAMRMIADKMISDTFKTPQQVIIGIQYSKAMNLEPIVGLRMMYVVNGKPSLYGEGPLALCYRADQVAQIREFFIDEEGEEICFSKKNLKSKVWGSVTQVWRKGDELMQEDTFTLDDMKRAKMDITDKGRKTVWEKYERLMMRYKARSIALRTKFPDLIAGIPIAEYNDNFSPETPEIKEVPNESELNSVYLGKNENQEPASAEQSQG